jgi:hypothetical protein
VESTKYKEQLKTHVWTSINFMLLHDKHISLYHILENCQFEI